MEYKNGIIYSTEEMLLYKTFLINKTFAILGIYESCQETKNFEPYLKYLFRVKTEYIGFSKNNTNPYIVSIVNLLSGMDDLENMNHTIVKQLVFHIIPTLKKMEV